MRSPNLFRRFARWLTRLLLRVGLLPASAKAETDTMGEWKRLQAEKDDPKPGLVLPDPNAPHAALIRRVRLYAQNGAKALGPVLDAQLPDDDAGLLAVTDSAWESTGEDREANAILTACLRPSSRTWDTAAVRSIHAAYNAPWTVIDGEVYEYESEKKRRVVQ